MRPFKPFSNELTLGDLFFFLFFSFPYLTLPLNLKPKHLPTLSLLFFPYFYSFFFLHNNNTTTTASNIATRKKERCCIVVAIASTITIGRRKGVVSLQQPLPPLLPEDGVVLCRCNNCLHHCHWKKERCCVDITTASTITTKGKDYPTISGRIDQCLTKQKSPPPLLLKEGKEQHLATL
jgi:hypothetical protein